MSERIGVFVCDCGTNIADIVDTKELARIAAGLPDVAETVIHRLWCSEEGRLEMQRIIKEKNLTRIIVAACSPKQHELTFQKTLTAAGLNPYLLQMVNLREQIAWVTREKDIALKKAVAQLKGAVQRVHLQVPLQKPEIECRKDFLVIGAGVAGIAAVLTLAQKGRKVYLLEREAWIGGKVVAYEDVYPNFECAPCMLEPKEDEILHNERITLLTNSRVENLKGFFGNFDVQIHSEARLVDMEKCIGCGACFDACPVTAKNKFQGNRSDRHAVYSAFVGNLPNAPVIDRQQCLRFKGENCTKCQESCPFGAIDYEQKDKDFTVEVGGIVVATGFDLYDIKKLPQFSPDHPNVIDTYQFERLMTSTGPTEGKILTAQGTAPSSIAFIHCAGSRDKNHVEYCSGVCCASALKLTHLARKKLGKADLYEFYSDWCLPGKGYQEFYNGLKDEGNKFIRVADPDAIKITPQENALVIEYEGNKIVVDMVVLSPAMVPSESGKELAAKLNLPLDKYGFFAPLHERLAAAGTALKGIYVAGCATGPKDIPQTTLQAQAAAGMALNAIVPGEKLELEAMTSTVDSDRCGGCRTCIGLCPYQAIRFDEEKKTAVINEVLCAGCGVCAGGCPAGAITNRHFTDEQIGAEIKGVLDE